MPRPALTLPFTLSPCDRRIIALARRIFRGNRSDFEAAVRALRAAVEESIPAGRIFLLGSTARGPIVGSLLSGVGLTAAPRGVEIVRLHRGVLRALGLFSP